jgi:hypothetical protein
LVNAREPKASEKKALVAVGLISYRDSPLSKTARTKTTRRALANVAVVLAALADVAAAE